MSDVALAEIQSKVAAAARRAERDPSDIRLVAVSKQQPLERIVAVLEQGQRCFGENRVQEAQGRWPALKERFDGVELRLIGPLQTNKLNAALDLFDVIETVDRPKLAEKLASAAQARGASPSLFIQVNTGEEEQKAGVAPTSVDAFVASCRAMDLPIVGLMAIPPVEEAAAPHFALLRKLAERNGLQELSMGMSADYEIAIAMGATSVRVGSALFGARNKPA